MIQQGYYSVVRWRPDPTRNECKNVAVVLVDAEGQFGGVKPAPISAVSSKLREQGLLDSMIHGIASQFDSAAKPDLEWLKQAHLQMTRSLILTEPKRTAVPDPTQTLEALYSTLVKPPSVRSSNQTKGRVLDKVIDAIRGRGLQVRRGDYFHDFLFDAIVLNGKKPVALEVLSFASQAKSFTSAEHDAGHFLFALENVPVERGVAVVQAPLEPDVDELAQTSYARVRRWFGSAGVEAVTPEQFSARPLALNH